MVQGVPRYDAVLCPTPRAPEAASRNGSGCSLYQGAFGDCGDGDCRLRDHIGIVWPPLFSAEWGNV